MSPRSTPGMSARANCILAGAPARRTYRCSRRHMAGHHLQHTGLRHAARVAAPALWAKAPGSVHKPVTDSNLHGRPAPLSSCGEGRFSPLHRQKPFTSSRSCSCYGSKDPASCHPRGPGLGPSLCPPRTSGRHGLLCS